MDAEAHLIDIARENATRRHGSRSRRSGDEDVFFYLLHECKSEINLERVFDTIASGPYVSLLPRLIKETLITADSLIQAFGPMHACRYEFNWPEIVAAFSEKKTDVSKLFEFHEDCQACHAFRDYCINTILLESYYEDEWEQPRNLALEALFNIGRDDIEFAIASDPNLVIVPFYDIQKLCSEFQISRAALETILRARARAQKDPSAGELLAELEELKHAVLGTGHVPNFPVCDDVLITLLDY